MPAPEWEDLAAFLDVDEFASSASITLGNGTTRTVHGIFDEPYLNAQLGEYETDISEPRLLCAAADLEGVHSRDTVAIDGRSFDVMAEPQKDGTGMATLKLAERTA